MLDQGGWNIRLGKREFMDFGARSQDLGLNTLAKPPGDGADLPFVWFLKDRPMMSRVRKSKMSWPRV